MHMFGLVMPATAYGCHGTHASTRQQTTEKHHSLLLCAMQQMLHAKTAKAAEKNI